MNRRNIFSWLVASPLVSKVLEAEFTSPIIVPKPKEIPDPFHFQEHISAGLNETRTQRMDRWKKIELIREHNKTRLIKALETLVIKASKRPNDSSSRHQLMSDALGVLRFAQGHRMIHDFKVVTDNSLYGQYYLKQNPNIHRMVVYVKWTSNLTTTVWHFGDPDFVSSMETIYV